jgi:hypothetical protein
MDLSHELLSFSALCFLGAVLALVKHFGWRKGKVMDYHRAKYARTK